MLVDPQLTPELSMLRLLCQNVNGLLLRTTPLAEACATVGTVLQRGHCYSEYALTLLREVPPQPKCWLAKNVLHHSIR